MGPQSSCSLTNTGIRHLSTLSELTELTINSTNATGECFRDLAKMKNLQHLGCSGMILKDADVRLLQEFKSLQSATMYDTCVDKTWIPFLETLTLEWVAFTVNDKTLVEEINERSGKPMLFAR